jgi:hypothetical protein
VREMSFPTTSSWDCSDLMDSKDSSSLLRSYLSLLINTWERPPARAASMSRELAASISSDLLLRVRAIFSRARLRSSSVSVARRYDASFAFNAASRTWSMAGRTDIMIVYRFRFPQRSEPVHNRSEEHASIMQRVIGHRKQE